MTDPKPDDSGNISLECECGWSFDADTESLAYKRRKSHEDLCDGEVTVA